ncbi:hypothetical protein BE61_17260 [Bradyrhizobium elkanii USDA 61]|nr:hypothetical protein BE61_17260 [Bradyrhizobium elkanii USDA 61]
MWHAQWVLHPHPKCVAPAPTQPRRFFFGFLPNFGFADTSGHCVSPAGLDLPGCFLFFPNRGSSPDFGLKPFPSRSDRAESLDSFFDAYS